MFSLILFRTDIPVASDRKNRSLSIYCSGTVYSNQFHALVELIFSFSPVFSMLLYIITARVTNALLFFFVIIICFQQFRWPKFQCCRLVGVE